MKLYELEATIEALAKTVEFDEKSIDDSGNESHKKSLMLMENYN